MRVELRQLRYFQILAEELHFGRAARRAFIAQPSLSQQIKALEAHLGVLLLERRPRGLRLTPAGARLLEVAREVNATLESGLADVRRVGGVPSVLRVGVLFAAHAARGPIAAWLERVRSHPGVTSIEVRVHPTAALLREVAAGDLEVGFVHAPVQDARVDVRAFAVEPYVVALPATHPRANADGVALEDLAATPFVLPPRTAPQFDEITMLCRRAGFQPRLAASAADLNTALERVRLGVGMSARGFASCA